MKTIPLEHRPFTSKPDGRYAKASPEHAPACPTCSRRYGAISTRMLVTWYRPSCDCAPPGLVKRPRVLKPELTPTTQPETSPPPRRRSTTPPGYRPSW